MLLEMCKMFTMFSGGRLLALDEVWKIMPQEYSARILHEKWSTITQQVCL